MINQNYIQTNTIWRTKQNKTFDSTTHIMMLTRDVLFSSLWLSYSIWYHLCDCPRLNWLDNIGPREGNSICIVDQLIVFFAWHCFMRHSLQGYHGVVAKQVITFQLITNQMSLNTKKFQSFLPSGNNCSWCLYRQSRSKLAKKRSQ